MMTKHEMKEMEALKLACQTLIDAFAVADATGSDEVEWESISAAFSFACEAMPDTYAEALELYAEDADVQS